MSFRVGSFFSGTVPFINLKLATFCIWPFIPLISFNIFFFFYFFVGTVPKKKEPTPLIFIFLVFYIVNPLLHIFYNFYPFFYRIYNINSCSSSRLRHVWTSSTFSTYYLCHLFYHLACVISFSY